MISNDKHRRRRNSLRRGGYDYAQPGDYFVTLCTDGHTNLFGEICDGKVVLSDFGRVVNYHWQQTMANTTDFHSPVWAVMPNHFHAIITISEPATLDEPPPFYADPVHRNQVRSHTISSVVRTYKSVTTRIINRMRHTPANVVWQKNFNDHIIQSRKEYDAIKSYIRDNPTNWHDDPEYLENKQH